MRKTLRFAARTLAAAAALAGAACGLIGIGLPDCQPPAPPPADVSSSPISKALRYLEFTQAKQDVQLGNVRDWSGDWPQCYALDFPNLLIRDINPYAPAYIHHALTFICEDTQAALGLSDAEIAAARAMRLRAVDFMLRFRSSEGTPDAGTIGYWLADPPPWRLGDICLSILVEWIYGGPKLHGYRVPANISFFPASFAIPNDADCTAVVYGSLLDHALLDGGPAVTEPIDRFFADWRDFGQVPRRLSADWIPERSGAFLTWLAYRDDPARPNLNDVDICVNAAVLYCLGRFGRLDTPGVPEAIDLVNNAMLAGVHVARPNSPSLYYNDLIVLHYYVTRAFAEGGVTALAPAVEALVDDLVATVAFDAAGCAFWDRGDPHLNTALAALSLMLAEREPALVDRAVEYLVAQQDPATGAWEPALFVGAPLDSGARPTWQSVPYVTAMALEALCRHALSP